MSEIFIIEPARPTRAPSERGSITDMFPEAGEKPMNEAHPQSDTSPAERPAPVRDPRIAVNSKGQPAHRLEVKAVPGPGGFLWWVTGLRYPIERLDEKTKTINLYGKPARWNVAGPFVSRAVAESAIAPSSRR